MITQASSYKIWQKIKAKQPSDYELAVPLSVWCKTEPATIAEYDALDQCTVDTPQQDMML